MCSQRREVRAQAEGAGGKRISQEEFTEKAWQAIVSAPAMANRHSNQIVETEHMFKVLLEEPNGLARRIVSKAGSNASRLLDKTEAFIKQQGRTSGDSAQVDLPSPLSRLLSSKMPFLRGTGISSSGWKASPYHCTQRAYLFSLLPSTLEFMYAPFVG